MVIRDPDLSSYLLFDSYDVAFIIMAQDGYRYSSYHFLGFKELDREIKKESPIDYEEIFGSLTQ